MDLKIDQAVGVALRELRRRKGLTQEALALEAGAERTYVSLIERGKNSPSVRMVYRLCAVLDTRPSELFAQVDQLIATPALGKVLRSDQP